MSDLKMAGDHLGRLVEVVPVNGRMVSSSGVAAATVARNEEPDMVNRPPHYNTGKIEVLDFILDQNLDYLPGNVVKYICRAPHKGSELQDLKKAQFCLNRFIAEKEKNGT